MLLNFELSLLVALAVSLWLALGGILVGLHYPAIRRQMSDGIEAGGNVLNDLARASYATRDRWGAVLAAAVQAIAARFVTSSPREGRRESDVPHDLPPVMLALFAAILLVAACATNYALLADLLPDLAGVAPSERVFPRLGWWIAMTSPAVILGGEAVGGLIGIRYPAGRHLFIGCLVFEILAALRRAADYVFESPFDAGQAVQISPVGAVQGATFVALGVLLPIVIYKTGIVLEPAFRALSGVAAVRAIGRVVAMILKNLPFALAIASVAAALAVAAVSLTIVALSFAATAWIVRHVVYAMLAISLAVVVGLPVFVVARFRELFRRPARAAPAMLLAALWPAMAGCNRPLEDSPATPVRFDAIELSEQAPPLPAATVLAIPAHRLTPELVRLSPVNMVKEPSLLVCVVDATGSIPASQRERMLRWCASRVAVAAPETTGAVVLVGEAGWSSGMPVVWRAARSVVTRCQANPPLPDVEPPTMLYDRAMRRARMQIDRLAERCHSEVTRDRARAEAEIMGAAASFVEETVAAVGRRVYYRTDLFGTLARLADLERAAEEVQGPLVRIDMELLSDLFDSANGCAVRETDPGSIEFACASAAVRAAQTVLARPEVHARFFQVTSSDSTIRQTSERWRRFWSSFAPRITVTTWSDFSSPPAVSPSAGDQVTTSAQARWSASSAGPAGR